MTTTIHSSVSTGDTTLENRTRALIWDWPTRVFHWGLVISFTVAWLTTESERYRNLHVMMGYTFAGLIAFRIVWGFLGSRYARFDSFLFRPGDVLGYLKSLLARAPQHFTGHNPAGAMVIFALLGLGIAVAASGIAVYQEVGGESLEELHEGLAVAMLAVVIVHTCGVIVSSFLHRDNLIRGMLTGRKKADDAEGIRSAHPAVGLLLFAAIAGFWLTYLSLPDSAAMNSAHTAAERDEGQSQQPDND